MKNFLFLTAILLSAHFSSAKLISGPTTPVPSSGTTNVETGVQLRVKPSFSSKRVVFQVSKNSNMSDAIRMDHDRHYSSFAYVRAKALDLNTTYYWRAKCFSSNNADSSNWSDTWSFTTNDSLTIYSPSINNFNSLSRPWISFHRVGDYDSFEVQLDTVSDFSSSFIQKVFAKDTFSTWYTEFRFNHVGYNTPIYMRGRGLSATNTSDWSETRNGKTIDRPNFTRVNNDATMYTDSAEFYWSYYNSEGYQFQFDTTRLFNSPSLYDSSDFNGIQDFNNFFTFYLLDFDQEYHWRIRFVSPIDTGVWVHDSFTPRGIAGNWMSFQWPYTTDYTFNAVRTLRGENGYTIQLDTSLDFNSPELIEIQDSNFTMPVTELLYGAEYWVRSNMYHEKDTSDWCRERKFTTNGYARLSYPGYRMDGAGVRDSILWWSRHDGTTHYELHISENPDFLDPILDTLVPFEGGTLTRIDGTKFKFGTRYYVKMRMMHASDTCEWDHIQFDTMWFTTEARPTLKYPTSHLGFGRYAEMEFSWDTMKHVSNYQFWIDTTSNFDSPFLLDTAAVGKEITINEMLFGQQYHWKLRGILEGDTSDWSETRTFYVREKPNLDRPSNNSLVHYSRSSLDWHSITGTTGYILELDTNANFTNPKVYTKDEENPFFLWFFDDPGFKFEETYYWRVKVYHAKDTSLWSDTWKFTIKPQQSSELVAPVDGAEDIHYYVPFKWTKYPLATFYKLQYATKPDFSNADEYITADTFATRMLRHNNHYYWRVRSLNSDQNEFHDWSEVWEFSTKSDIDDVVLTAPANGSRTDKSNVLLQWENLKGHTYFIEFSTNSSFVGSQKKTSNTNTVQFTNLGTNKDYYWKVRAKTPYGDGAWSEVWHFDTKDGASIIEAEGQKPAIAPNPTSGIMKITNLSLDQIDAIKVYDQLGRETAITHEGDVIDATQLSEGMYYVVIDYKNGTSYRLKFEKL